MQDTGPEGPFVPEFVVDLPAHVPPASSGFKPEQPLAADSARGWVAAGHVIPRTLHRVAART
jgi:hypothetical protein